MDNSHTESALRVSPERAEEIAIDILTRHGFSDQDSRTIATHLVEAELLGCPMMGLVRLRLITELASQGRGEVRIIDQGRTHAHIDGAGNPGYLSVTMAMEIAIEKAKESAIAMVGVVNSSLSGMIGNYLPPAVDRGLLAIIFVSSYGRVAPYGGIDPVLGTNPIAFGFPGAPHPIIVDVATSAISNGEVELAQIRDMLIPPGTAINSDGEPTQDPEAALRGALLPLGGHKGYGLGLALQILGLMVGGDPVPSGLGNQGIFLIVLDPTVFGQSSSFQGNLVELRTRIKASSVADGFDEILIPGEGRVRRRNAAIEAGILIPGDVLRVLESL